MMPDPQKGFPARYMFDLTLKLGEEQHVFQAALSIWTPFVEVGRDRHERENALLKVVHGERR